jgi:UDP-2-acetamido-3-amino-2,3-dideoxy-glucuronate N-acetyltransferase
MSLATDVIVGIGTKIWHPENSNIYGCNIGSNCNIGTLVEIRKNVIIGNGCKIQAFVFIPEGVTIGNNVFIGPHVCFTNDKYPRAVGNWEELKTTVENDASIGAGSIICPGITVGEGSMVGAGSVVTKDVPPHTLVVGNPARVVRSLRDE